MGSYGMVATVVVKSVEVVAAGVFPVAESWLAMSNLDLPLPPLAVGVFMCYDGDDDKKNDAEIVISMVKKGLRQVLVSFYPLAGEVVMNKDGEPELLCNNRGVDFVQAAADIDLNQLDIYNPDVSIHAKFVPIKKNGVLSVQVTAMKCGGLVIGCSFDHRVADAHSFNKFLVAWAHATSYYCKKRKDNNIFSFDKYMMNKKNNMIPSYRRSLLNPRRPGHHDTAIDNMYTLIKDVPALKDGQPPPSFHLQSRIYQISANQIQNLQSEAGPGRSKFESFSAFIWKLLAKAGEEDKKRCKLGIVVNGRKCLSRTCDHNETSASMDNYFGNVLSVPYSDASVGELKALPLCKVANIVHECVESAANEEHFRGVVDWVEDKRPHQPLCKVYTWEPSETEEVAVVVSSGQRFPVSQLDFGWGSPSFASYYFPWGGFAGYVMPLPIATHDHGDWIVYMYLFPKHLLFIEKEVPHIFKPFHF